MDSIIKTVIITYPNNRTTEHPLDYIQRTVSWRFSVFPRLVAPPPLPQKNHKKNPICLDFSLDCFGGRRDYSK